MARPANSSADSSQPAPPLLPIRKSPVSPLLIWLVLQLIALAIPIFRIPFFATKSFPSTPESLALGGMLVVQIGSAALLFPFLTRDARATAMVIAASWPFTVLAGFLASHADQRKIPAAAIYASAWLIGLALWNRALRSPRVKAAAVAVAALLAFGGPVLWYLHREYGFPAGAASDFEGTWGPILGAIAVAERDPLELWPWLFMGLHVVLAALACAILAWKRRRESDVFTPADSVSLPE